MTNAGTFPTVEQIVAQLNLQAHPTEGGYFAETYRSDETLGGTPPGREGGDRAVSTAIYYLITPGTFSHMHLVASDEVFHFYLGDPVEQLRLFPDGTGRTVVLGPDILAGQEPQSVVPRGVWQGARLREGGRFALLGATVAPGFEFADYRHGERGPLTDAYPAFAEEIARLTHERQA